MNQELPGVHGTGYRKGRGTRDPIANIHWIIEKSREFQKKHLLLASLVAQRLKRLPTMRRTWVWSLGREVPLEREMAIHSSILAWRIPRTEEPGGLQSTGSQRVGHDWVTSLHFALLTMPKPLTVWITTNCGEFRKRWEYQTIWPTSWEICMQVKKQQLELDMEQQTGSKSGKEYNKAVYCHPI